MDFIDKINQVENLDVKGAMTRLANSANIYKRVLTKFSTDMNSEVEKMSGFISQQDMPSFSISVHGMKGALLSIGAQKAGDLAFALETASKNGELEFCEREYPALKDELIRLNEQISKALAE